MSSPCMPMCVRLSPAQTAEVCRDAFSQGGAGCGSCPLAFGQAQAALWNRRTWLGRGLGGRVRRAKALVTAPLQGSAEGL